MTMWLRSILVCVGLLFGTATAVVALDSNENSLTPEKADAVDRAVQAAIAEQKLVGVAVGILQQGRVVFLKGYGDAHRERRVAVTADTKFNCSN